MVYWRSPRSPFRCDPIPRGPKIVVLSGSPRHRNAALPVANVLVDQLRSQKEAARCVDLSRLPGEALVPVDGDQRHGAFIPEERVLIGARGVMVVVEERLGAMPGELKLFLDQIRYPELFVHLPCCFVGVSDHELGTLRAIEQAELTLHHLGAHLYGSRVVMRRISQVIDAEGKIPDLSRRARLFSLTRGFVGFVDALRSKPLHSEDAIPTIIAAPPPPA